MRCPDHRRAQGQRHRAGPDPEEPGRQPAFGRVCSPQDVGNLCVFLCSDEGGYISGHPIFLDGGAVY